MAIQARSTTSNPRYTVYPFRPSNDGAYNAPLPLITCENEHDATAQAETFDDADIVVCYEDRKELFARRTNGVWQRIRA